MCVGSFETEDKNSKTRITNCIWISQTCNQLKSERETRAVRKGFEAWVTKWHLCLFHFTLSHSKTLLMVGVDLLFYYFIYYINLHMDTPTCFIHLKRQQIVSFLNLYLFKTASILSFRILGYTLPWEQELYPSKSNYSVYLDKRNHC